MSIHNLFNQVKTADITNKYRAIGVPGIDDAYLASDGNGRPCVFLKSHDNFDMPSLSTERLSLNINQRYCLSFPEGLQKEEQFHALFCLSDSLEDIDTFLTLVEAFFINNKKEIKAESIISLFHSLIRLFFIKPDEDVRSRRQGLWGELLLMRSIIGYYFWAPYWQTESNRLFDFSSRNYRIEVKTTTKQNRIHAVSHKQVFSQSNDTVLITSILLREDDVGISLRTLISECREIFKETPDYFKLETAIRHAKMQNPEEDGPKFDINYAVNSIKWFNSKDVPKFELEEPEGVTGTHYIIDLTKTKAVEEEQVFMLLQN